MLDLWYKKWLWERGNPLSVYVSSANYYYYTIYFTVTDYRIANDRTAE
jgi:hypothetical protein